MVAINSRCPHCHHKECLYFLNGWCSGCSVCNQNKTEEELEKQLPEKPLDKCRDIVV